MKEDSKRFLYWEAEEDDSDIKIAGQEPMLEEDAGDTAVAEEYLRERENGNIERARQLGRTLATELFGSDEVLNLGYDRSESPLVLAQRRILFSFVAGRAIDELTPNSILADTAVSVFYDVIKEKPVVYGEINDAAAISLYMLTSRAPGLDACAVGRVFAKLCGREGSRLYAKMGSGLCLFYYDCMKQAIEKTEFVQ
ncbi:hypothetical protein [Merdimmobilis hominis]|jgi:hypothetical protein|uniref:Uncharacterized protein n=1 Tax=uncultured Anaerotruncus sp. TaxID=905011 RepID=A0A6N2SEY2_9FIRM|nr:hypothetical protein [Merdimmobilis hominis]MCD4836205.1 hypothetical protein [Merdimmobilis hominis]PWL64044.1 MAG: hypothetical protein DBY34_00910 [Oscillospiraceae bacterium]